MLFRRAVFFGLAAVCFGFAIPSAGATKPNPEHKVTLCHRTDSRTNPYVIETVDVAQVLGPHGHDSHNGPIFTPLLPKHTKWGDIIPPFNFGPGEIYAGKNWPAGAQILDAGCKLPTPSTTTTEQTTTTTCDCETTTTATTTEPTTTTLGETTTSPVTETTEPVTTTTERSQGIGHVTTTTAKEVGTTEPVSPHQSLPFTGSQSGPLAALGAVFVALGLTTTRRRHWRT